MNLVPVPRSLELTGGTVPNRPSTRRRDSSLRPQGYELHISPDAVELAAADEAGFFYGQLTLAQLAALHDGALPAGVVRDYPDLPVRGVMLDISRDKVPTTTSLHALIDRLASLKINQLQLYSEHTFAYRRHQEVHAAASPLDAGEILALDAYCRERHVELVPNQNCLGHMNRWLAHERYRPLAIAPDGFTDPYGITRAPMTIEPNDPRSLELVRELLAELMPLFTSRRVHVGLDEAWELPPGRIDDFLSWAATLRGLPELEGREMLMWGDMVSGDPELVARLPAGVTVCEWGYDDWYPFDERCAILAEAGIPFWVAPGTSSWMSILGRVTNARNTCQRAAAAALAHGATGYLNTDWGDLGHLQQPVVSEPGFAYGAAVSWCLESNQNLDLGAALSTHVFNDATGKLADAVLSLGDAHRLVSPQFPNMSTLVMNLYYPQLPVGRGLTKGLAADELDGVEQCLGVARAAAAASEPERADGALLRDEVAFSIDLVGLLLKDARARLGGDGFLASVAQGVRAGLGTELDALTQRYRDTVAGQQPSRRARRQPRLAGQPSSGVRDGSAQSNLGRHPGIDA